MNSKIVRKIQLAVAAAAALLVTAAIVPTTRVAIAQTCSSGSNSFVVIGSKGQDSGVTLTGTGATVTITGKYNGSLVHTSGSNSVTITIVGTSSKVTLVNSSPATGQLKFTRTSTPGTSTITTTWKYVTTAGTFNDTYVVKTT